MKAIQREHTYREVKVVASPPCIVVVPVDVVADASTMVIGVGFAVGETITVIVPWSPSESSVAVGLLGVTVTTVTMPGGGEKAG